MKNQIKGGYYIKARCVQESWVAHASPCVRETWDYLLNKANHKDKKYNGFIVKRGQAFLTYREIREALSWKVGYRKEMYNENQMKHSMNLLTNHGMIQLANQPRGNLITVLNYDKYQDPKNYESTDESTNNQPTNQPTINQSPLSINKKEKNEKNKNNIMSDFETFWTTYPRKENKKKAGLAFMKVKEDVGVLVEAVEVQKKSEQWKKGFIPHATTWLNGERWKDQVEVDYQKIFDEMVDRHGDPYFAENEFVKVYGDEIFNNLANKYIIA